ncbi:MAG: hypothetical protein RIT27_1807 [Pseudomonadota bacterium]|jgi:hypothetical protein
MGIFDFISSFFRRPQDEYAESGGGIITPSGAVVSGGTAFASTLNPDDPGMIKQHNEALKYQDAIREAASRAGLPTAIICGIGSRESRWGLALKPATPAGRGDFSKRSPRGGRSGQEPNDGPGFGRGLMQIDYDFHEFARTGNWQDPYSNLMYAADILNKNRTFLATRGVSSSILLRAMIAAYNCGATAALGCYQSGSDIDCKTTGRDYSRDVLNRAGWFQMQGWY